MKKSLILFIFLTAIFWGCSGNKTSEANSKQDASEMDQISKDAQTTAEEIELETDQLENAVDSLLSDI